MERSLVEPPSTERSRGGPTTLPGLLDPGATHVPTPEQRDRPIVSLPPVAKQGRRPHLAILGCRGIPARYGGFETFVEEISVRLVQRSIDVTVFCERGARDERPLPAEFRGVKLEYARAWAPGPLRTLQFDARCLAASCRRFDVVYMLGYGASVLCAVPRVFGREVWINMDGLEWRRSKWNALARAWLWCMERVACAAASRLVFDNARLREEVEARRGRRTPSNVIEYGTHVYERDDELAPLERFALAKDGYFLAVMRMEPENHALEIVRAHAAARIDRPLVVVADIDRRSRYARQVRAAAGPGVRFVGTVYDPAVLQPLRRHAYAYVHGHSVGGTNPSLLEAMGCANLVLAHDNPFNRETLDGQALFWRDESELVERWRASESLGSVERARLRDACVQRARTAYDWERISERYAELVREACA